MYVVYNSRYYLPPNMGWWPPCIVQYATVYTVIWGNYTVYYMVYTRMYIQWMCIPHFPIGAASGIYCMIRLAKHAKMGCCNDIFRV